MKVEREDNKLRPFDLDAVKSGGLVQHFISGDIFTIVAGPDAYGYVCVSKGGDDKFHLTVYPVEHLRMAPLCWVEGKPVYKGDVLYQNTQMLPGPRVVMDGNLQGIFDTHGSWNGREHLTWTPPKEKRKVKMLAYISRYGFLGWTREDCFEPHAPSGITRVPSEDKIIEIEEQTESDCVSWTHFFSAEE